MSEYIDKAQILAILCADCAEKGCIDECPLDEVKQIFCRPYALISGLSSADVRPVVRGKWEIIDIDVLGKKLFSCPRCGGCVWRLTAPNYCLNCGADMRDVKYTRNLVESDILVNEKRPIPADTERSKNNES